MGSGRRGGDGHCPARDPGSLRRGRQANPKTAACSKLGFDAALPAHAVDTARNNGEADTCAFVHLEVSYALKDAEDLFMMCRIDADAVVLHVNQNAILVTFSPDLNAWRHARRDEFKRIIEQI
jgi:hypothetical protein